MKKKLITLFVVCLLPSATFAGSGDANNDGKIDVADIVEIVNYISENHNDYKIWTAVIVDLKKIWSDANVDGKIDLEDVKAIADYLLMTESERQNRGKALSEATGEDVGSVIASDGRVYPAGTIGITPIAMIVYVGQPGTADCHSNTYRGLAIALSDAGKEGGTKYLNKGSSESQTVQIAGYESVMQIMEAGVNARDGLSVPVTYSVPIPQGNVTSGWFMPSAGQYIAFYHESYGLGFDPTYNSLKWRSFGVPEYDEKNNRYIYYGNKAGEMILGDLRKAGDTTVNINNFTFWTCSPTESYLKTGRVIFTSYLDGGTGFQISNIVSTNVMRIRPFLAF